jgi:hypothetical protein
VLDEVRVSTVERSADWIAAEYANQAAPQTFAFVCSEETSVTQAPCTPPWSTQAYAYSRPITIDHTKVANTDQTNFPVLIAGTYPDLANTASGGKVSDPNGYDMLFCADANCATKLDHEIDEYDPSTGTLNAWLRIPTLSHTTDTPVYLFYGNTCINASRENRNSLWSNSNYVTVYHFGSGASLSLTDSTSSRNTLANAGATAAEGEPGGGAATTAGSYLQSGNTAFVPSGTTARSISLWFRFNGTQSADPWIGGYGSTANGSRFGIWYSNSASQLYIDAGGTGAYISWTADGNWHHVVAEMANGCASSSCFVMYLDGAPQVVTPTSTSVAINTTLGAIRVSGIPTGGIDYGFSGFVDEFRISNVFKSGDWISTEFNNQSAPSSFYLFGAEQRNTTVDNSACQN